VGASVQAGMDRGPHPGGDEWREERPSELEHTHSRADLYGTARVDEDGNVDFYDDIYGHDAKLALALAKGYPY